MADLFDNHISTFKTLQDSGKKVICYFSAGSYEDWREDKGEWDDKDLGKGLEGWAGEKWVNVSSPNVHKVMKERINLAWRKGCDAIDPDNVDGYVSRCSPSQWGRHEPDVLGLSRQLTRLFIAK